MGSKKLTANSIQIAAILGLLLGVVIFALVDYNLSRFVDQGSLAVKFRASFRTFPFYPWIIGVLLGHFYHPFGEPPLKERLPKPWNAIVDPLGKWPMVRIGVAVGASSLVVAILGWALAAAKVSSVPAWIMLSTGMVFGAFLWPTSATKGV